MGRTVLEPLALFLGPFARLRGHLALRARYPLEIEHWTRGRVSVMTLIGLAAAVLGLIAVNAFAPRGRGVYIPAHVENGVWCRGVSNERPSRSRQRKAERSDAARARSARASAGSAQRRGRGNSTGGRSSARSRARRAGGRFRPHDDRYNRRSDPPRATAGFKVALTGVAHGTVTIVVDGRPLETTTLREDVETDGRWAKVAFGRDFAADAQRRDSTINALSLSADGTVDDYCRGARRSPCSAGALRRRCGRAHSRGLSAHPPVLSVLRPVLRAAASTVRSLRRDPLARGLTRLSRERVRAELMKLSCAGARAKSCA